MRSSNGLLSMYLKYKLLLSLYTCIHLYTNKTLIIIYFSIAVNLLCLCFMFMFQFKFWKSCISNHCGTFQVVWHISLFAGRFVYPRVYGWTWSSCLNPYIRLCFIPTKSAQRKRRQKSFNSTVYLLAQHIVKHSVHKNIFKKLFV